MSLLVHQEQTQTLTVLRSTHLSISVRELIESIGNCFSEEMISVYNLEICSAAEDKMT